MINNVLKQNTLIVLFFFGLLVRLLFINFWPYRTTTDTFNYIYQAKMIINGTPVAGFPNGFPIIITILILIFGKSIIIPSVLCVNLLCQIATAYFINKINDVLNNSIAVKIISLALFSAYPTQIYFTNMILTESFSTLLLTALVYNYIKGNLITAGVLGGVLSSFRMVLLPLIPIVVVIFLLKKEFNKGTKLLLGFCTILLLFQLADINQLTKPPNNFSYNLLIAINGYSSSMNHNLSKFSLMEKDNPFKTYILFMFEDTKTFILQRLNSLYELWGPYSFEVNNKYLRVVFGFRFILLTGWLLLVYRVIKEKLNYLKLEFTIICSASILLLTVFHVVYFSSFRFIVPLEPVLIIGLTMTLDRYIQNPQIAKAFFEIKKS